jgi:hypothetical protein
LLFDHLPFLLQSDERHMGGADDGSKMVTPCGGALATIGNGCDP